jgi:hypothetical protein
MALADRLKNLFKQGEGAVGSHKDQSHQAVDKAADMVDQRTHGKYSDKIDKAQQKADEAVDKMGEEGAGGTAQTPGQQGGSGTGA